MPSLKEVARADAPEDIQKVYDAVFGPGVDPVTHPGTATGTPGNWWSVFALVPDCFRHAVQGFQFYRGRNRQISPKLRELDKPEPVMLGAVFLCSLNTVRRSEQLDILRLILRRSRLGAQVTFLPHSNVRFWRIPMTWCWQVVACRMPRWRH